PIKRPLAFASRSLSLLDVSGNRGKKWSSKTEWHRITIFRPRLAEYAAMSIKKGPHVLVESGLVSSMYAKTTSCTTRVDVVRKLDRGEPKQQTISSRSDSSEEASESSNAALFQLSYKRDLGSRPENPFVFST
ncbi:MAG: single-stranded DNA-binding protein, partial [Candidatus Acidiferrales bacterium]